VSGSPARCPAPSPACAVSLPSRASPLSVRFSPPFMTPGGPPSCAVSLPRSLPCCAAPGTGRPPCDARPASAPGKPVELRALVLGAGLGLDPSWGIEGVPAAVGGSALAAVEMPPPAPPDAMSPPFPPPEPPPLPPSPPLGAPGIDAPCPVGLCEVDSHPASRSASAAAHTRGMAGALRCNTGFRLIHIPQDHLPLLELFFDRAGEFGGAIAELEGHGCYRFFDGSVHIGEYVCI
jgi:hypothetical protein